MNGYPGICMNRTTENIFKIVKCNGVLTQTNHNPISRKNFGVCHGFS